MSQMSGERKLRALNRNNNHATVNTLQAEPTAGQGRI